MPSACWMTQVVHRYCVICARCRGTCPVYLAPKSLISCSPQAQVQQLG